MIKKVSAWLSRKINKFEYLTGEEIGPFNQRQIIGQAKFAYSPLAKTFEKQTGKHVDAIKSLDTSNNLKQIEGKSPQNLMDYLIRTKLREIVELQGFIKYDDQLKCGKTYNFNKYSLPFVI